LTVKNLFPNGWAAKLEGQRPTSKKKTRAGGEVSDDFLLVLSAEIQRIAFFPIQIDRHPLKD
jgi:hypothetical protein